VQSLQMGICKFGLKLTAGVAWLYARTSQSWNSFSYRAEQTASGCTECIRKETVLPVCMLAALIYQISRCCLISSPSLHSSSRTVLSNGLSTSSSSPVRPPSVPALPTVAFPTLPALLLLRFFFLNQPLLLCILAASASPSTSEVTDAAYSRP
jgi:hypothetical protein